MDDKEKHVDESWKEQASQEKDVLAGAEPDKPEETPQEQAPQGDGRETKEVEVNFLNYVTSLAFQAMIFMGEIPNPVTQKTEKNLSQSKFLIDTLLMLKEKTEGNLSDQEKQYLENSIYELQMRYVQITQNGASSGSGEAA